MRNTQYKYNEIEFDFQFAEYYNGYRDEVIVEIIPLSILRIVLQIVGMVGNGFIVSVTIQYK